MSRSGRAGTPDVGQALRNGQPCRVEAEPLAPHVIEVTHHEASSQATANHRIRSGPLIAHLVEFRVDGLPGRAVPEQGVQPREGSRRRDCVARVFVAGNHGGAQHRRSARKGLRCPSTGSPFHPGSGATGDKFTFDDRHGPVSPSRPFRHGSVRGRFRPGAGFGRRRPCRDRPGRRPLPVRA